MASPRDLLNRESSESPLVQGIIAGDAETVSQRIEVVIPSFHPSQLWGPCDWPTRVDDAGDPVYPQEGDPCVVGFVDTGEPGAEEPEILLWRPQ